ncbi:MAG: phage holin family protein [Candidatus Roizmanbacteria bacterium]|nr:phage holin family protein [Candidatus Roizmanbacteria bacterium]
MRSYIRRVVYYMGALYATSILIPGFSVMQSAKGFLIASIVVTLAFTFLSPLIRVVLLPINIITLGIFSWLAQVVVFYIALLFFPTLFSIRSWNFVGWQVTQLGITIAPMSISVFATIIIAALMISFIAAVVQWILG